MTTASVILAVAETQEGYTESPAGSNRTKFGEWYGVNGQPWCAIFLSWLFRFDPTIVGGKFAYTPSWAAHFRSVGAWGNVPKRGALVFFDFPDSVDRIQHVEIVKSYDASTITTIGGNTSSGPGGSQSNGGGVYQRVRPRDGSIVGYGYPAYESEDHAMFWVIARVPSANKPAFHNRVRNELSCKDPVLAGRPNEAIYLIHTSDSKRLAVEETCRKYGELIATLPSRTPADASVRYEGRVL